MLIVALPQLNITYYGKKNLKERRCTMKKLCILVAVLAILFATVAPAPLSVFAEDNPDRVYGVEGGSPEIAFTKEIRISPGIAINGEAQKYSVWAKCAADDSITSVVTVVTRVVDVIDGSDREEQLASFDMKLVEGNSQLGRWEGGWIVDAPKDTGTFWFHLTAQSMKGYTTTLGMGSNVMFPSMPAPTNPTPTNPATPTNPTPDTPISLPTTHIVWWTWVTPVSVFALASIIFFTIRWRPKQRHA